MLIKNEHHRRSAYRDLQSHYLLLEERNTALLSQNLERFGHGDMEMMDNSDTEIRTVLILLNRFMELKILQNDKVEVDTLDTF